jgi:hypothetical protein
VRGLLMAQRRRRDFCQKPHARGACQLAVKGAAKAAIEISFQDRPKSAERSGPADRRNMSAHLS